MNGPVLANLRDPDALHAAARSRAFRLFTDALSYPEGELEEAIREGLVRDTLLEALAVLDPALVQDADARALGEAGDEDELAVEYTRLFDVGTSGPPCPLYGGLYGGVRMQVMEEAVRFYNHFGLHLSEQPRELPDHLLIELEFLHFLAFREAGASENGEDPGPWRRAQRDFIARHPGAWVPKLRSRLGQNDPPPYIDEVVRLLARTLAAEASALARETAEA